MIVQLLHKLSIRGVNGSEKLLRVIKVCPAILSIVDEANIQNPITDHFPTNTIKLSMSSLFSSVSVHLGHTWTFADA